jgi:hypothetical protein
MTFQGNGEVFFASYLIGGGKSNVSSNCSNRQSISWNHGNKNRLLPSPNACWLPAWPCVTVWAIAADKSRDAAELRAFLIKLSGRQMKHKKEFTNPALLAGLWVFLSMLEIMEAYSRVELSSLKITTQQFFGKVV